MKARYLGVAVAVLLTSVVSWRVWAHCQIPCGIYDDEVRFKLMVEHVTTIEKSMREIEALSKAETPDQHQLVRWVVNKEHHAEELSQIVTFYFMAQRLTPTTDENEAAYRKYIHELTLLHRIIFNAMKTKQTVDLAYCEKLRGLIAEYKQSYFGETTERIAPHSH